MHEIGWLQNTPKNNVANHPIGLLPVVKAVAGDLSWHKQGNAVWVCLCMPEGTVCKLKLVISSGTNNAMLFGCACACLQPANIHIMQATGRSQQAQTAKCYLDTSEHMRTQEVWHAREQHFINFGTKSALVLHWCMWAAKPKGTKRHR